MRSRTWKRLLILLTSVLIAGLVVSCTLVSKRPGTAAVAAGALRGIIGNQAVAQLETAVFTAQDIAQQWAHDLGFVETEAPWQLVVPAVTPTVPPLPTALPVTPIATLAQLAIVDAGITVDGGSDINTLVPTPAPTVAPSPTPSPTPSQWSLPDATAYGNLTGEGIWQHYIVNPNGDVVGLRTFLQPDPERPHAIVAIVAIDLERTKLHYVLGSEEPSLPGGPRGFGFISPEHMQSNKLLATFNGGFLATHGEYGAMANGIAALAPKAKAGTVAIYENGQVRIGKWGEDILPEADLVAWRQNGDIVVHQGEINERVHNGSIRTWGGNLNGAIVTWRSGLGISPGNQILYYFAGPSLSMPTLATAMKAVGTRDGILLDINPSWVHFVTIQPNGDNLEVQPLFEEGMDSDIDRYLRQSMRDFFYVTGSS